MKTGGSARPIEIAMSFPGLFLMALSFCTGALDSTTMRPDPSESTLTSWRCANDAVAIKRIPATAVFILYRCPSPSLYHPLVPAVLPPTRKFGKRQPQMLRCAQHDNVFGFDGTVSPPMRKLPCSKLQCNCEPTDPAPWSRLPLLETGKTLLFGKVFLVSALIPNRIMSIRIRGHYVRPVGSPRITN